MSDLSNTLRQAGHPDLADALERKQLTAQLRESGRNDLADRLETSEAPAEPEPPKSPELQMAEGLRDHLNESITKWHSFGGGE